MAWVAAAMALAQIGGSIMNYQADKKLAESKQAFLEQYRADAIKNAWEDFANNANLTELQNQQEQDSIRFEGQQAALSNKQAQATAEASALENGVSGNSIDSLSRGYERTTAINEFVSGENIHMKDAQKVQNLKELRTKALSYINTAYPFDPTSIVKPSIGANIISGINNAAIGYQTGKGIQSTFSTLKPGTTKL